MTVAKKTTVLHVVGAMNRGGVETFMMNVLRNVNKDTFDIVFLCYLDGVYDYEEEIGRLGGRIIRIKDNRISAPFSFISSIVSVIEDNNIKIVHSHVDYSTSYAMLAAKKAGVPLRIAHSHNTRATKSKNIIRNLFPVAAKYIINRYANVRLACEEAAGRALFYKKNNFEVLHNGIDLERFSYSLSDRNRIRRSLGIDNSKKVLLHVGRFEEQKNHTYLIDVFSRQMKDDPNTVLILVGDGSLAEAIRTQVREAGAGEAVFFAGKQSDMAAYYSAADVFVLPSLYEGLPVSLVEAQANGLTCLVSDTTDSNADLGSGCMSFISLRDKGAWVKAIATTRARNGIMSVTKSERLMSYDIKTVTKRLESIYSDK